MDAPYDGTEVTIVAEETEAGYVFAAAVPAKKKKNNKGAGDQGDKAKKPRSAYLLYYYDIHLKVQQDLPNLPQSEINKKISESWRQLSVAEKSYYLEKAKLEKEGLDTTQTFKSITSATVPDIPGFRKILPRSDYIIIPKPSLNEDSRQPLEHRVMMQVRRASGGGRAADSNQGSLLCQAEQSFLLLDPSHAGITEHCLAAEGLTEEAVSFHQPDVVQEVVTSENFSHYISAMTDKVSGDIILEEDALKLEDDPRYETTDVVVEETVVDSPVSVPSNGMIVARQQLEEGVSVLAVKTERAADIRSSSAHTQFIVVPVPGRTIAETETSIKLATTYTRRGHGSCTLPGCSYTYVTRRKPPNCPHCGTFLGGKWIPKEKSRGKSVLNVGGICKTAGSQSSPFPPTEPFPTGGSTPGSAEESLAAVSQLLSVAPAGDKLQEAEWEEVIISESHMMEPSLQEKACGNSAQRGKAAAAIETRAENSPGASMHRPVEGTGASNLIAEAEDASVDVGVNSPPPTATQKGQELRNKSRSRPALLAAARPMRAILPAPVCPSLEAVSEKLELKRAILKKDIHLYARAPGLKLSTLKQLGHSMQPLSRAGDRKVRVVPVNNVPQHPLKVLEVKPECFPSKYSCTVTLDLGLATSRGRGKCKNPACNYVYTNRHKPPFCPSCGFYLSKDRTEKAAKTLSLPIPAPEELNISQSLSQSQKETQRLSTLQLLRKVVQIPEYETELSEVLALIQDLNSSRFILSDVNEETVTIEQTSWSNYYESPAVECLLCSSPLFKGDKNSPAGPQECWLLTANRLQMVTAQVKMCLNPQCLALHSFTDIYTGLFNLGNKLLVSLDLLFTIRNYIKLGEDPNISVSGVLDSVQEQTEKALSPEELPLLHELLCKCYWAFECLTIRDYNDMICGVCGIAPKVEIAQRNVENTLALKNIEFTWPECLGSSEVNVEDFWFTMEMEVIEQAAFPSGIPITKFDAAIVAPFFAPLMRGVVVVNTEKDKNLDLQPVPGNGSALVQLLQEGSLKLEQVDSYDKEELRCFLTVCNIPWGPMDSKDELSQSLLALHANVQNGSKTSQPPPHFTGGKVYKVCPHQVVCGSKYIVRGESARDHVDLLVSSRHWPPVYMVDIATQVALCADTSYPDLTSQMWGQDQGCFSSPFEPPKYVSCPELLDQHYNVDMTVAEPSVQHPVTKSTCRRIVHTGGEQSSHNDYTARHRSLSLCRELEPYGAILNAIHDSKTSTVRQLALTFDNATHYYLYNRLIDFLTSRDIVNRQIHEIVQSCQPGEVVIRDTLYRLGVAQIKTEDSMDEEEEGEEVPEDLLEPL